MKKLFLALLAVFSIALVVAGCGGDSKPVANSGDKKVVLKVGATPVPHAEILNLIKPQLAKEGVDLQIIEFSDYVKPNLSLADKELDRGPGRQLLPAHSVSREICFRKESASGCLYQGTYRTNGGLFKKIKRLK